jgi:hypothetical protein
MSPLPATDLRSNVGTWSVPSWQLPALASQMLAVLGPEKYDPDFKGQYLQTTYFDTKTLALRKARSRGDKYVTIRIRCYAPASGSGSNYPAGVYAISAKTESQKSRQEIAGQYAEGLLSEGIRPGDLLGIMSPDIIARIADLTTDDPLMPVVTVCFNRFAAENDKHRLTLDVDIYSDTGKHFPSHVLEQKSTNKDATLLITLPLRPIKLSKFLWATA